MAKKPNQDAKNNPPAAMGATAAADATTTTEGPNHGLTGQANAESAIRAMANNGIDPLAPPATDPLNPTPGAGPLTSQTDAQDDARIESAEVAGHQRADHAAANHADDADEKAKATADAGAIADENLQPVMRDGDGKVVCVCKDEADARVQVNDWRAMGRGLATWAWEVPPADFPTETGTDVGRDD